MAKRWTNTLTSTDVTPEPLWLNRRKLLQALSVGAGLAAFPNLAMAETLEPNSWEEITTYNNFYEFGTGKDDPSRYADALTTDPWSIEIDGMVERPGTYSLEALLDGMEIEERIYRMRCVEAWSMIVPWNGFELADLLERVGVKAEARYVAFETLNRPSEMRGQRRPVLEWPYREGLRLDEARNPLTILATGLYGRPMPNQNGAPIRLVVPWKYGFKSIKSISRITLTDTQPETSWNMSNPREYGFYSNVNPEVRHPRWSQESERVIGGGLFNSRKPTLKFNGYEQEVAGLYDGMSLKENF